VEGVNLGGMMLGFLAVIVFAITSLAALGLLITARTRAAHILFASGWFAGACIATFAGLSFLSTEYHREGDVPYIVLTCLSLFLGGVGQFVAARRGPWTYLAALACTVASLLVPPAGFQLLGGDYIGGLGWSLVGQEIPLAVASLVLAVASLLIAIFLPFAFRPTVPDRRVPGP
jgi:hypothetical protein